VAVSNLLNAIFPSSARRGVKSGGLSRIRRAASREPRLGGLRRIVPVSPSDFGGNRGQCIDRYYIENFLSQHAADVRGRVLDFADDTYARRFGGNKTTGIDVLHATEGNPHATIVADLAQGAGIPSDAYDCILCTQVLLLIYDLHAAVRTLYRILKPGGVALVTAPGIQKISRGDMNLTGDYWRFTTLSTRRLFEEAFPTDHVEVQAFGNVLAAVAFLHGFAVEDLRPQDLDSYDPAFQVSIALRAVKPREASEEWN